MRMVLQKDPQTRDIGELGGVIQVFGPEPACGRAGRRLGLAFVHVRAGGDEQARQLGMVGDPGRAVDGVLSPAVAVFLQDRPGGRARSTRREGARGRAGRRAGRRERGSAARSRATRAAAPVTQAVERSCSARAGSASSSALAARTSAVTAARISAAARPPASRARPSTDCFQRGQLAKPSSRAITSCASWSAACSSPRPSGAAALWKRGCDARKRGRAEGSPARTASSRDLACLRSNSRDGRGGMGRAAMTRLLHCPASACRAVKDRVTASRRELATGGTLPSRGPWAAWSARSHRARDRGPGQETRGDAGQAAAPAASRSAARARSRVESSVGNGESAGRTSRGNSVQESATASQPRVLPSWMTRTK